MILSTEYPLVSIITLCYNQADIVSRAIESVMNQTYPNIQLVVVDDGSRDNSRAVIQSWKDRYPDKIKIHFPEKNVGHPRSMNAGYSLCDGELITFCDGDDWYFPEKVEREVNFLRNNPEYDVVHSNYDFYTIDGKFIKHWTTEESQIPTGDIYLPLLALEYPYTAHLRYEMTSKKILDELGYYYDPEIPIWVDWDLRLRLAAKYKFGYCHYVGSAYTMNPEGLTHVLKLADIFYNWDHVVKKNINALERYDSKTQKVYLKKISVQRLEAHTRLRYNQGKRSIMEMLRLILLSPSTLSLKTVFFYILGKPTIERMVLYKKKVFR